MPVRTSLHAGGRLETKRGGVRCESRAVSGKNAVAAVRTPRFLSFAHKTRPLVRAMISAFSSVAAGRATHVASRGLIWPKDGSASIACAATASVRLSSPGLRPFLAEDMPVSIRKQSIASIGRGAEWAIAPSSRVRPGIERLRTRLALYFRSAANLSALCAGLTGGLPGGRARGIVVPPHAALIWDCVGSWPADHTQHQYTPSGPGSPLGPIFFSSRVRRRFDRGPPHDGSLTRDYGLGGQSATTWQRQGRTGRLANYFNLRFIATALPRLSSSSNSICWPSLSLVSPLSRRLRYVQTHLCRSGVHNKTEAPLQIEPLHGAGCHYRLRARRISAD
jgi:hypothetical protein